MGNSDVAHRILVYAVTDTELNALNCVKSSVTNDDFSEIETKSETNVVSLCIKILCKIMKERIHKLINKITKIYQLVMKIDTHKYLIPICHTVLWGLSIYVCSLDWGLSSLNIPNTKLVEGACVIYITFMIECVINLLDFSFVYRERQFSAKIIQLLMKFVGNVVLTLIFVLLFLKFKDVLIGYIIVLLMCWLKYINVSFANRIDKYMKRIEVNVYSSTF